MRWKWVRPVLVHHHQLAVEDHVARKRRQRGRDLGERGGGVGPAAIAKPGRARFVGGQQPEPVVLQLEDPAIAPEGLAHRGQHQLHVVGAQGAWPRGGKTAQLARESGPKARHDGNLSVLSCAVPERAPLLRRCLRPSR
jgi:hypothetical protein